MTQLDALLAGIVADPREETRWLVLADWLQEYDDPRRAELLRLHRQMLATCCEPDAHPRRAEWQARMVEVLVAGARPCVPQETLTLPGGVPMTFAFIPPGAFLMGGDLPARDADVSPARLVEVTNPFFMGVFPVTQEQWFAVTGTDPSGFKGPTRPVVPVMWVECQEFCTRLRQLSGGKMELPTEVEWKYARRAGTTTDYHFGDVINTDWANYFGGSSWNGSPKGQYRQQTTAVDSFPPNAWGLTDLHGNAEEWCADVYAPFTGSLSERNIRRDDTLRVKRGGSWNMYPSECRASSRRGRAESRRDQGHSGFRVCLRLD